MELIIVVSLSLLVSGMLMPLTLCIAQRKGWYDKPNERKLHTDQIPRLGGVGIFWAFMLALGALVLIQRFPALSDSRERFLWIVLLSAAALHFLGLADDFLNLRARYKFLLQLAIALLLVSLGFRFRVIIHPFGDGRWELGWLSYPLTLGWIIGVTNALNLIDGMDGLAGGLTVIAASVFGVFFLARDNLASALVCFSLVGAVGGFLLFNLPFPKARIFMGDSGSLLLGFLLSMLPLLGPAEGVVEIGILSAVTTLLVPIADTLTAIIRRSRAGISFFDADKRHLHHKLLLLGLSVRQALGAIYLAALVLGLAALSTIVLPVGVSFWIKIASWAVVLAAMIALHYATQTRKPEIELPVVKA